MLSLVEYSWLDAGAYRCLMVALCFVAQAQQDKSASAKTSLTGRYEGTAKNKAEEVITVSIDLTEKEGALSGTINSSHGDFPITGGSRQAKRSRSSLMPAGQAPFPCASRTTS